ncbi:hypothetical protein X771_22420 [Mesorhizobium sp. LSJC277A00]|nr:hypothetical protein X771_22420 [Mesorhizobium sp. LSJC277A00]
MRPNPEMNGRDCGHVADSPASEQPQNRRMQKAALRPNSEFSEIMAPAC